MNGRSTYRIFVWAACLAGVVGLSDQVCVDALGIMAKESIRPRFYPAAMRPQGDSPHIRPPLGFSEDNSPLKLDSPASAMPGDEHWSKDFYRRGVWGEVFAVGEDAGDLVVGGRFTFVGATAANNIARWDGAAWRAYGDGVGVTDSYTGYVQAIIEYGGHLIVGGDLRKAGQDTVIGVQAAYWDGGAWRSMGQGDLSGRVEEFRVYNGQLYAAGVFTGGQGIAVWDGAAWCSIGAPFQYGYDLLLYDGKLIIAGQGMYAWDGAVWTQPYGTIINGGFMCATEWNGSLVAGGPGAGFEVDCSGTLVAIHGVAMWDGHCWQAMGGGLYGWYVEDSNYEEHDFSVVWALAVHDGVLCAGGRFELTDIGGQEVSVPYAAAFVADHWQGLGGGTTRFVYEMAEHGPDLVVGGWMAYAGHVDLAAHTGDIDAWGLVLWNGTSFRSVEPVGRGLNGPVHCIGQFDGKLIVAGEFLRAGEAMAKNIAAFDGSEWQPLGNGLEYSTTLERTCYSMAEYEGSLIVGGRIARAGDIAVRGVARWDGESWSTMGAGIPGNVNALCVYNGSLLAGRYRWDGSAWEDYFPVDGDINAFCVWNEKLVLGGAFHNAGSISASHIAIWDGVEFEPLGAGTDRDVMSLAVSSSELLVGGNFSSPSERIARWDGANWHGLGIGLGSWVWSIAVHGNYVFAGGRFEYAFTTIPGQLVNHVAYWDGDEWHAMGRGCSGTSVYLLDVYGVSIFGGALYVGGDFTTAAGMPSLCLAKWRDPAVVVSLRSLLARRRGQEAIVRWEVADASAGAAYEVWRQTRGSERIRLGKVADGVEGRFVFVDGAPPAGEADYWLLDVSAAASGAWYGPAHLEAAPVPERLLLAPAAPNPFNPRTTIGYALPQAGQVELAVYDLQGRLVRRLLDKALPAGEASLEWDGLDGRGNAVPSGVYLVRLRTEQGVVSRKVTLAR